MKQILEISREMYDHKNPERSVKKLEGLNGDVVRAISEEKQEPEWMLSKRLKALKLFLERPMPKWGPDLSKLDFEKIRYYMKADEKTHMNKWEDVPEDIKKTFERLGIPEAEKKALAGAGAMYESEVMYHNLKKEWDEKGVIFEDMDVALKEYPELVKKYFMSDCVPINDHKFASLHASVWSGGTFIYVPKNIKVTLPLQAYFRMNAPRGGQFEHTLIIADEGAEVSYVEGCFTKGTLIKTNMGDKPIEGIKVGDLVLTHKGIFKPVYKVQNRPYTGSLYKILVYGDSTKNLMVTAEHPFLCVRKKSNRDRNKTWDLKWVKTKELNKNDYLVIPRNKTITKKRFHEYEIKFNRKIEKIKIPITKEFFRLVGYYLAEGSTNREHYLNFSFNVNETKYIKDVKTLLSKVFKINRVCESHHKKNHGVSVVVCSSRLARIFKKFGTSNYTKQIPDWMMLESPEKQKELLIGWFRGDGNYFNKRCMSGYKEAFRTCTTSCKLANQTRELLIRVGIPAFINSRNRSHEGRRTMYTVGVGGEYLHSFGSMVGIRTLKRMNNKKRGSMFYADKDFIYTPIRQISRGFVEKLPVYNFSVEDDESYVASVAVHNCSSPLYSANSIHAGCVEIFVHKNARVRYHSIENWSRNTYNLNTKRAIVFENGTVEWINGNFGSHLTMLYPCSVLKEKNARSEFIGIAYAGKDQNQDTGHKVFHLAPNTSSTVVSKSISKDGGKTTYRGMVHISKGAVNSKCKVQCDALMLDNKSVSNTIPYMDVKEQKVNIGHEASVGKIDEEKLFYLQSRGLKEEEARKLIVSGFVEPITKELPMEYAIELNRLVELEMETNLG